MLVKDKLEAINSFPVPEGKKDVRSFYRTGGVLQKV